MKRVFTAIGVAAILFTACKKDKPKTEPSVTTATLTNITTSSAVTGGTITSDGNAAITASGIVLSKVHATPTLSDTIISGTTSSGSFTVNLTNLDFGSAYYIRAYATNSVGTGYGDVVTLNTVNDTAKVRFTYMGQTVVYGIVTSPTTGRKWMDRNLGAGKVAAFFTDATAYGDLFQWGRLADGHQLRTSDTTSNLSVSDVPSTSKFILGVNDPAADWRTPSNDNLWQGNSGVNNPCPTGWHVPTQSEWQGETALVDSASAYSIFKLVGGGYRFTGDASMQSVGTRGKYWSATRDPSTASSAVAWALNIRPADLFASGLTQRGNGMAIRCIKN